MSEVYYMGVDLAEEEGGFTARTLVKRHADGTLEIVATTVTQNPLRTPVTQADAGTTERGPVSD